MSRAGKITIGLSAVVAIVIWLLGGAMSVGDLYRRVMQTSGQSQSTHKTAMATKQKVAVIEARMDVHHAAQMQRQDRTYEAIERISDKIDGFHSK